MCFLLGSYIPAVASDTVRVCTVYENYFPIGAAINTRILKDSKASNIAKIQFNSITAENAMKPSELLNNDASNK